MNDVPPLERDAHRLALLAHELRTPLNAIIGYAEAMTIEAFGPLPAPYGDHAATIRAAAAHLLSLVDGLTDQAQAETGVWAGSRTQFDPVALAEEVADMLRPRAEDGGITITVTGEAHMGSVKADRRALRQILLNLIDNALKFTGHGGEVTAVLSRDAGAFRMEIRDTGGGCGKQGAGLGLRLVRALSAAHDGAVEMARNASGGMTVLVRLPILTES